MWVSHCADSRFSSLVCLLQKWSLNNDADKDGVPISVHISVLILNTERSSPVHMLACLLFNISMKLSPFEYLRSLCFCLVVVQRHSLRMRSPLPRHTECWMEWEPYLVGCWSKAWRCVSLSKYALTQMATKHNLQRLWFPNNNLIHLGGQWAVFPGKWCCVLLRRFRAWMSCSRWCIKATS